MSTFNEEGGYKDDEEFRVPGKVLNQIAETICDLKSFNNKLDMEVTLLKDKALHAELNDLRLRDKNPTLRDAWDQYQTILALTSK